VAIRDKREVRSNAGDISCTQRSSNTMGEGAGVVRPINPGRDKLVEVLCEATSLTTESKIKLRSAEVTSSRCNDEFKNP